MDIGTDNDPVVTDEPTSVFPAKPHDELWGRLIVAALSAGLLLTVGFIVFLGYRVYVQRSGSMFSIADIPDSAVLTEEVGSEPAAVVGEPSQQQVPQTDAKNLSVSVLNGGGAKGSAGVLADLLKRDGYAKATAGNAEGEYSGVTVFYLEGQEESAKSVHEIVAKSHQKAAISPSDPGRKETGMASVTVVIGK